MLGHSIGIDLSINGAHDCTILDATGQPAQRFAFDSSAAGLHKLEQQLRAIDPSHGAAVVVMEPTGLAWFLPCLYLRAQHPAVKVVRIKTSKVAALRRYLKRDAKSDRIDSLTLAKMPLVDPEELYAVDLPPAALQGLDRMTRQRARFVESLVGRKNRLQALLREYLPGLMDVAGKPWEPTFRAVITVTLNPFALARQSAPALRKALQDKRSRNVLPEGLVPRLLTACEHLTRLYRPIVDAGLLTETFFDDVRDEVARELRLMDMEKRELEELEAAIARRYREVAPEDRLGTLKGLGPVTAPTLLAAVGTPQRFHSQAAFRGWTGVVPHARQSADSDAKGLTMTKAGPRRVKLALYQAADIARRWDPQLGPFPCPECQTASPGYDRRPRRWRHLDTCQLRTWIEAEIPRVQCPQHGVKQIAIPWAEPGSQFTVLFERLAIDFLRECSVTGAAALLRLTLDEAWGIKDRAVRRGLARRTAEPLPHLGVDEQAITKGHRYLTVVADLGRQRVLFLNDDRTAESPARSGRPARRRSSPAVRDDSGAGRKRDRAPCNLTAVLMALKLLGEKLGVDRDAELEDLMAQIQPRRRCLRV